MEFRFDSKISTWDMWKLSMNNIYHSIVGVYNTIMAVAIILLTIKFWNEVGGFLKGVLLLCSILFPILQPLLIYRRAAKQVSSMPKDMMLEINDTGIHVTTDAQKTHISWNRVKQIILQRGMIIIAIESGMGYMLTDRSLGAQKEELLNYLQSKTLNNKS